MAGMTIILVKSPKIQAPTPHHTLGAKTSLWIDPKIEVLTVDQTAGATGLGTDLMIQAPTRYRTAGAIIRLRIDPKIKALTLDQRAGATANLGIDPKIQAPKPRHALGAMSLKIDPSI